MVLVGFATRAIAQTDKETTAKIVENKTFNFMANAAIPMASNDLNRIITAMPGGQSGSLINLGGGRYDVKVTKDSIVAYLPYYGRAYVAPYSPSEGGIKFTSKDFSYKKTENKKGTYIIQINTKDLTKENYRLTFNISTNGYASLSVISVNRQSIVFNGYLEEPKQKEQQD